jgi:5-(carboxyamino)imidazole ribonucleotide synthase
MFAIAARRMGYRVHTYSPDTDTPTGQVADVEVTAEYEDLEAVRGFARGVSVVTFEFENVPYASAQAAAEITPVRPGGQVLHTTQHRLREKTWLSTSGFPVAPFRAVRSEAETIQAVREVGTCGAAGGGGAAAAGGGALVAGEAQGGRAIVKTAGWGYDGKGQVRVNSVIDAGAAWRQLAQTGTTEAVVEGLIDFDREVSVMVARGVHGQITDWGVFENQHVNGILDLTIYPARLPPDITAQARTIAHNVAEKIGLVGVLCVEFFVTRSGQLIINELAPRPHNSGHLTFDFSVTSQFEQQLRAVCGLPLGDTTWLMSGGPNAHGGAAMAQLLGDLWLPHGQPREPNWNTALQDTGVKLHLYGKHEPRPGRKMGHLSVAAPTPDEAIRRVLTARQALLS